MFTYTQADQAVQVEIVGERAYVTPVRTCGDTILGLRLRIAMAWNELRNDPSAYLPSDNWAEIELARVLGAVPPEPEPSVDDRVY